MLKQIGKIQRMSEIQFPKLEVVQLTGEEKFIEGEAAQPFGALEFWRWMGSDLVNNAMRGVLAEFIVAQAMGCAKGVRVEWDAYDVETADGLAIEVKSAAYCQTWAQKKLSTISFDIAPKEPDNIAGNNRSQGPLRSADVYVFCVLKHQDKATLDPLNLTQWDFYVLPTRILNERVPMQKSIALSSLLKLGPRKESFETLREAIRATNGRD